MSASSRIHPSSVIGQVPVPPSCRSTRLTAPDRSQFHCQSACFPVLPLYPLPWSDRVGAGPSGPLCDLDLLSDPLPPTTLSRWRCSTHPSIVRSASSSQGRVQTPTLSVALGPPGVAGAKHAAPPPAQSPANLASPIGGSSSACLAASSWSDRVDLSGFTPQRRCTSTGSRRLGLGPFVLVPRRNRASGLPSSHECWCREGSGR